jgi:benzylsuccinate CoA-transferase BbsE subunit
MHLNDQPDGAGGGLPYAGLRVIELSQTPAGDLTGKLLGDLGAEVLKVEPSGGSPLRWWGPFVDADGTPESVSFCYYNTSKRSALCDVGSGDDRRALQAAVADADVLVSTWRPDELRRAGLDIDALLDACSRLIIVSITPFGLTGPRSGWVASDLVSLALGGLLHSCGYDDHTIPPIRPGENQSFHCAASFGHIGTLLALLDRQRTGRGQLVDIAVHDCVYVNIELANPYWFYPRTLTHRQTGRHAQPRPTMPSTFLCADGRYVYLLLVLAETKPWRALVEWLENHGMACGLGDPSFDDVEHRQSHYAEIHSIIEAFLLSQPADAAYRDGQARQLPIGVVNSPGDVLDDPHLRARRFFQPIPLTPGRTADFPGVPMHFSAWPTPSPRPAPPLGSVPLRFPNHLESRSVQAVPAPDDPSRTTRYSEST